AAGASLIYYSLALGPVSVASPIFCVVGISVPVLVGVLLGERPTALAWTGVALAVFSIPPLTRTDAAEGAHTRAHVHRTVLVAILSLAPATTVLLARATLGERWSVSQRLGLALALAAGACISLG